MVNNLAPNFTEIISIIEKVKTKTYKTVNNGLIDVDRDVKYISPRNFLEFVAAHL
jgi:hypothetical protein